MESIRPAGHTHAIICIRKWRAAALGGNFIFDPGHLVKNSISIAGATVINR
jgi:hypothetical protein